MAMEGGEAGVSTFCNPCTMLQWPMWLWQNIACAQFLSSKKLHFLNTGKYRKTAIKKSRIRETLNLSTDADHRTNNFFGGGDCKKKNNNNNNNIYM